MARRGNSPVAVAACSMLASLLAGCGASPATSEAVVQQERLQSWRKLCEDRGFVRGTSDFDVCVMGYDREAQNPPIR